MIQFMGMSSVYYIEAWNVIWNAGVCLMGMSSLHLLKQIEEFTSLINETSLVDMKSTLTLFTLLIHAPALTVTDSSIL